MTDKAGPAGTKGSDGDATGLRPALSNIEHAVLHESPEHDGIAGDPATHREQRSRSSILLDASLRITEIFLSIQGESSLVGRPTVFVRLTGCPLRCSWCDTTYSFQGGDRLSLDDIIERISAHRTRHVCVTGGEPLAQPAVHALMRRLCDQGFMVSLETSGALPIDAVDYRVRRIVDFKPPSSGEASRNLWSIVNDLRAADEVKFVIGDRQDYEWSVFKLREHRLDGKVENLLFSPVHGQLDPRDLATWILEDRLPVRMQVQLHKIVWGEERGR